LLLETLKKNKLSSSI